MWFYEERSKVVNLQKQTKLQDPSQINAYKQNSIRRDTSTRVGKKKKQLKCKINEM
jgi:hypothetical protein